MCVSRFIMKTEEKNMQIESKRHIHTAKTNRIRSKWNQMKSRVCVSVCISRSLSIYACVYRWCAFRIKIAQAVPPHTSRWRFECWVKDKSWSIRFSYRTFFTQTTHATQSTPLDSFTEWVISITVQPYVLRAGHESYMRSDFKRNSTVTRVENLMNLISFINKHKTWLHSFIDYCHSFCLFFLFSLALFICLSHCLSLSLALFIYYPFFISHSLTNWLRVHFKPWTKSTNRKQK